MVNKSPFPDASHLNPSLILGIGDLVGDPLHSPAPDIILGGTSSSSLLLDVDGSLFNPFAGPGNGPPVSDSAIYRPPGNDGNAIGAGRSQSTWEAYSSGQGPGYSVALGPFDGGPAFSGPSPGGDAYLTPADIMSFTKGGSGTSSNAKPGGGGGGPSTASYTNGSLTFKVTYDSNVNASSDGANIKAGFAKAIDYFLNTYNDPITINLSVGWGEVGGIALDSNALGASLTSYAGVSYSSLYGQLGIEASSGTQDQKDAYASLTGSNPIGGANYYIAAAEAKALGYRLVGKTGTDGYVGFGSGDAWDFTGLGAADKYDFVGVAEHEISETMGRTALLGASSLGISKIGRAHV